MAEDIEAIGQGEGASLRDRATHEQSQQAVSAVPVGIPSAGQWAVVNTRGAFYSAVRIERVTPRLIKVRSWGNRMSNYPRDCIVALFPRKETAERMVQVIDGVRGGFRDARSNERKRHQEAMNRIAEKQERAIERVIRRVAQAIEARSGETEGLDPKDESAVRKDAPNPVQEQGE